MTDLPLSPEEASGGLVRETALLDLSAEFPTDLREALGGLFNYLLSLQMKIVELEGRVLGVPEPLRNVCSRCYEAGMVESRHPHGVGRYAPIEWLCSVCGRHVCFNCALTVEGSVPLVFHDQTLCSKECWVRAGSPDE